MKMVECKKCGNEYSAKMRRCPKCRTKTPVSSIRKVLATFLSVFIVLFVIIVISAIGDGADSTNQPSSSQTNATQTDESSSQTDGENIIYSDSDLKITFNKIADGKDLGVTACYIYLKVENLGSKTVNVSLTDAYANDTAVTVMSGLPMKLAPGKNSQQPFLFGYNEIFTSADEVENLEFKVTLYDENYTSIVKTTESITVNVK